MYVCMYTLSTTSEVKILNYFLSGSLNCCFTATLLYNCPISALRWFVGDCVETWGEYSLIQPIQRYAARQNFVWVRSVLNRVYNYVWVCQQGIAFTIDLIRKINCVWVSIQKFKTGICSIAIADENAFKKACMDFLLCPDQGNKIERGVVDKGCI